MLRFSYYFKFRFAEIVYGAYYICDRLCEKGAYGAITKLEI